MKAVSYPVTFRIQPSKAHRLRALVPAAYQLALYEIVWSYNREQNGIAFLRILSTNTNPSAPNRFNSAINFREQCC